MYRYRMAYQGIGAFVAVCVGLFLFNPAVVKTVLAVAAICVIPALIIRFLLLNQIYKHSIRVVNKQFVLRDNALHNEHVTVIFTPDEKIVVMDTFTDKRHAKRMFTLKKGQLNINKAWNRACRVFDSFMTLDSLKSFFSYDTNIEVITLDTPETYKKKEVTIDKSSKGPRFVEMDKVKSDSFGEGSNIVNDKGASFVEMENIQEQEKFVPKKQKEVEFTNLSDIQEQKVYVEKEIEVEGEVFSDLGDILSAGSNKIDVNFATASEISILPGINIVGAKKIVEYRDLNGLFKSADEFFEVANVKEHFVQKIRPMIVVGKPVETNDDDDDSDGRVVDL